MLFSSLVFLFVFLPVVLVIYYLLKGKARNYFLLLASLIFYAWGEPKFVFVMMTSIIVNYVFGILVERDKLNKTARAKALLVADIAVNLGILFIFKYLNFAVSNIDHIFADLIPQTSVELPIGISFFTFQAMSYVIDVYRGEVKAQKNVFYLGMYISLFPQLIAGPIVRYSDIEEQIESRTVTFDGFGDGVRRFIIGLAKKVLIANNMAIVADWAFGLCSTGELAVLPAWMGAIAYTLQIFFDFSGYSDMAIGLGKMFGFTYKENFNYPYLSRSATEFWRRWHISLGSWFRDYVYIPLGGSRVSSGRHIFNLFVVWLLTGIWHGANWTFIVWGMLYFVLIAFEKKTGIDRDSKSRTVNGFKHIYAMFFVVIGWVIFRAETIGIAVDYIATMMCFNGIEAVSSEMVFYLHEYWFFIAFAILYSTAFFRKAKDCISARSKGTAIISVAGDIVYPVLLIISVSYLVIGSYNPFIYFNF